MPMLNRHISWVFTVSQKGCGAVGLSRLHFAAGFYGRRTVSMGTSHARFHKIVVPEPVPSSPSQGRISDDSSNWDGFTGADASNRPTKAATSWLMVIGLVYLLITAVGTISAGFKIATGGQAKELFAFATNPFLGLIIGTMATALIQSSSTVTSIIVALVAGGLPIAVAVPMIMGANIGTTITNTIVSLGHVA